MLVVHKRLRGLVYLSILGFGLGFGVTPSWGKDHPKTLIEKCSQLLEAPSIELQEVAQKYDVPLEKLRRTPVDKIPVIVKGLTEKNYTKPGPEILNHLVVHTERYDVIVVGGGLAGLETAHRLDGSKVMILENESKMGGLASADKIAGHAVDDAAAYWSPPIEVQKTILGELNLRDKHDAQRIHEWTDSYVYLDVKTGQYKYCPGIWENPETMNKLPGSFSLNKEVLPYLGAKGQIVDQPIEKGKLAFDKMTAQEFYQKLPEFAEQLIAKDPENTIKIKEALKRYRADSADLRMASDSITDLLNFLTLYSRSAHGEQINLVNAEGFLNFYLAELGPRYTTTAGTRFYAEPIEQLLRDRGEDKVAFQNNAQVVEINDLGSKGVDVTYVQNGVAHRVRAKKVAFSAPIGLAPKLIKNLDRLAPAHKAILDKMEYANYLVHTVVVEGHPWRDGYDLWLRASDYNETDPTDVIAGRWMDPEINGYKGMKDFKKNPGDDVSFLTIYQPLGRASVGAPMTDDQVIFMAESAVRRTLQIMGPLVRDLGGGEIKVKMISSKRWLRSIHISKPGHYEDVRDVLSKPIGNIYLANNNLGTPSVEEALYRGYVTGEELANQLTPGLARKTSIDSQEPQFWPQDLKKANP